MFLFAPFHAFEQLLVQEYQRIFKDNEEEEYSEREAVFEDVTLSKATSAISLWWFQDIGIRQHHESIAYVKYHCPWENFEDSLTEMVSEVIALSVVSENQNLIDPVHPDKPEGRYQIEAWHSAWKGPGKYNGWKDLTHSHFQVEFWTGVKIFILGLRYLLSGPLVATASSVMTSDEGLIQRCEDQVNMRNKERERNCHDKRSTYSQVPAHVEFAIRSKVIR